MTGAAGSGVADPDLTKPGIEGPDMASKDIASPGFGELMAGSLGVRLATTAAEIDAVQALR